MPLAGIGLGVAIWPAVAGVGIDVEWRSLAGIGVGEVVAWQSISRMSARCDARGRSRNE